ncbi:MAG: prolyl oligopeptidase family serine peptidase [Asticcacaulis sp.]
MTGVAGMLLCGAAQAQAPASAQAKPFTYKDMIGLDRLSAINVDRGGHRMVMQVRQTDMEKNKGVNSLWLKDLDNVAAAEVKLKASDGGATDPQFSPDGKTLYFLSSRSGSSQLWKTDLTGDAATQVTKLPLDVGAYEITPDGKGVVLSMAVYADCKGDEINCTVKRQTERKADKSSGELYTKVFVRHWDEWEDGTRNHLFYLAMDGAAAPIALTDGFDGDVPSKPFGDEADYTIAPDGKTVYFSARLAGKTEPWSTNFDIYSVPVTGGAVTDLTSANKAWDAAPRLSPDGKTLAYLAMKRPGFEADRYGIMLRDLASGTTRELDPDWDRSPGAIQWSKDGKSLLADADDLGKHILFRVDATSGKVTPLTRDGHTTVWFETPRGLVFLKDSLTHPSLAYLARPKAAFADDGAIGLTQIDSALAGMTMGSFEPFTFKGWNNDTVYGYVIKPAGYVEGHKYPVAFLIHGGPLGSFGDDWSFRWNPETYAGAGYAVVMIDFHGSTGYGQAFEDAISTHWGDRPLEDLQKGWDAALAKYPFLDGNRACALGASYGGFMVNWIAGNWKQPQGTQGWKCLVSHDGVFDARSMGYSTEEQWFEHWEHGGDVYQDPSLYDKFDPALHAKDWSVPMLVIHSDKDFRIPVDQGIGVFTALQAQNVESEFLHFPDENHWVLKPANSLKWHETVFNWLDSHIGSGAK